MEKSITVDSDKKLNKSLSIKTINLESVKNNNRAINLTRAKNLGFKGIEGLQNIIADYFKKSEENYRSFFENSLDGIYKSTLSGKYIDVNPALVRMLG